MFLRSVKLAITLAALLCPVWGFAHHSTLAKFDDKQTQTMTGLVELVDWKNPHVHIFMNVQNGNGYTRWAVEMESRVDLDRSGWSASTVKPGDIVTVKGIAARDGSHQVWANSVVLKSTGKPVFTVTAAVPPVAKQSRPTPRYPDGQPRLGAPPGETGYWAFPSATSLMETGINVQVDAYGLLKNIADSAKIAPFQRWAKDLYEFRQRNFLKDDPMFLDCKPPGGPREYQLPYGVQFVENRDFKRIFVLIGNNNRNYRLIYTDGRINTGQVQGDSDNPLYYGRSVGKWNGDTLVLETTNFNEKFWFSNGGLPHTEQLKLTENFTRHDFDTLRYDVTIDDPGAYTRPWSSGWTMRWVAGQEMPVYFCQENRP